jgi:glycosyltransferase involved in cell wall biosynthesis
MRQGPLISVIIPVHNGARFLPRCLEAVLASTYRPYELILVDDASTDGSAEIGRRRGATVLDRPLRSGPAAARNDGAREARGEIYFFVDADVVIRKDTMARVADDFARRPEISAVFGSYDDDPAEGNFVSRYKNLFHHFVHQHSNAEAGTFWAGCGAIRRDAFEEVGGFDPHRYPEPSVEDIELGLRLRGRGRRILLDKDLQVKHLKRWDFASLVRADVWHRAVPWSRLILERKGLTDDLNLKRSQRVSAGFAGFAGVLLPAVFVEPRALGVLAVLLVAILVLNWELYRFFARRQGIGFAARVFPLHLLYYLYSGTAFAACWISASTSRAARAREGVTLVDAGERRQGRASPGRTEPHGAARSAVRRSARSGLSDG